MVKPNFTPEGEACTLLVTPTKIIRMVINTPFVTKKWRAQYSTLYANRIELRDLLTALIDEEVGCWN